VELKDWPTAAPPGSPERTTVVPTAVLMVVRRARPMAAPLVPADTTAVPMAVPTAVLMVVRTAEPAAPDAG
jgi:hypothetical protein